MDNEQPGNYNYVDVNENKFILNKNELAKDDVWSSAGVHRIDEGINELNTAIDYEIEESETLFSPAEENASVFAQKYEPILEETIKSADSSADVKNEVSRIVATLDATPNAFRNPSNMRMFLMEIGLS